MEYMCAIFNPELNYDQDISMIRNNTRIDGIFTTLMSCWTPAYSELYFLLSYQKSLLII